MKAPFLLNFQTPISPGSSVQIDGVIPQNASLFTINFFTPRKCCLRSFPNDTALSISFFLDGRYSVLNNRYKGRSSNEKVLGKFPFPSNADHSFSLEIFATRDEFLVAVNGVHYCSFLLRNAFSSIKSVGIDGDVQLDNVSVFERVRYPNPIYADQNSRTIPSTSTDCDFVSNDNFQILPLFFPLSQKLQSGFVIRIEGRINMLPYSFRIDLQNGKFQWPSPIIALHINGRYSYSDKRKNILVLNSRSKDEKWGKEIVARRVHLPSPGNVFCIRIVCHDDHFSVSSNHNAQLQLPYRSPLDEIRIVHILGDIQITSIVTERL